MKLLKEKAKNGGYIITVLIGNKGCNSYWSAPPIYGVDNHHFNFEVEYLQGRYSIINTKGKAKQFSSLYKNLWIEVSPYQLELMQDCIGVGRKQKPYRNRFFTRETDKDWNELVKKGLAIKGTQHINDDEYIYFWLSHQGVEYVLGKSVSEKVYKEL